MEFITRLLRSISPVNKPVITANSQPLSDNRWWSMPICDHLGGSLVGVIDKQDATTYINWTSPSGQVIRLVQLAPGVKATNKHVDMAIRILDDELQSNGMFTSAKNAINSAFA